LNQRDSAAPHGGSGFRPDIQGLRAIAVLLVLVFHVLPSALPGGFVGVDVFFVISGFLITGLLLRELEGKGRIALATFYVRRIKRLLPAATVVLIAVGVGCLWLLPIVRWKDTGHQLIASALYAQNWLLLKNAADYWAQDVPQSPVVHYWSLSIEEQFYMVWPCLMTLGALVVRRTKLGLRAALAGLSALIFAASLAYSVLLTSSTPSAAYFSTGTRAWELALGAFTCIALEPLRGRLPAVALRALGWLGVLGVVAAGLLMRETMAFPGWIALLPTVSAALLLFAGPLPGAAAHSFALSLRPMRYLGDISYSLYLWHWPLFVFFLARFGHPPSHGEAALLVLASLVLAALTKVAVEDRLRNLQLGRAAIPGGFALGVACIALSVGAAKLPLERVAKLEAVADAGEAPGALVLLEGEPPAGAAESTELKFVPSALKAKDDVPLLVKQDCHSGVKVTEPEPCEFGKRDASVHVVLVGDSHAAQWLPALLGGGEREVRVTTVTKTSCPLTTATLAVGTKQKHKRAYRECREWNERVKALLLKLKPSLVVTSHATDYELADDANEIETARKVFAGYSDALQQLAAQGLKVLAIRDTPLMGFDVADCVATEGATLKKCSKPRSEALPTAFQLEGLTKSEVVDLSDFICRRETCPPVVGGVLVYRDSNHLTATYAKTLAPFLWSQVDKLLGG
jgi:peptidoglycan/LPS O-acetylase OafA/YrhL